MKILLTRRLTTACLLSLLCLTAQVAPALCAARPARARGNLPATQTQAALAESLPESDILLFIDYKRLFDEANPRILADLRELREQAVKALDEMAAITGLDLRAAGRVVTGVRLTEVAGSKEFTRHSTVSLTRGVDQEKWLAFVRQKGPAAFKESRHGAKTLQLLRLTAEEKKTVEAVTLLTLGDEALAFAALDAETFAYGSAAGVRAAVDARAGSVAKIKAELANALTHYPDALVGASGLLLPGLSSDVLPVGNEQGNEFLKMLATVKRLSFVVELAPAGLNVTVTGSSSNAEQAKVLGDVVTAVKLLTAFSKAKSARDRLSVELFKSLAVLSEGNEVRIKSELTDANVRLLVKWAASDIYLNSGAEHQEKDELDAALADYDKAVAIDPDNVKVYISRGQLHSDRGELDAAEADDTKALTIDPDNAIAYNNRGYDRVKKGAYDEAIVDLAKAIALDPNLAVAYTNRGHVLAALGRHEEALTDFDKLIALDPENASAYANRGQSRYELGDHTWAIADFDKALTLDPKLTEAYNGRGYTHTALGEYDMAIADHDKALALDPKSAEAFSGRGLAFYQKDEFDAAIANYDKAIALNPESPDQLYSNRGFALASKGNYSRALADFEKTVAVNPKSPIGYHGRGFVRYEQGEYAAAIPDFDKAIAIDPKYAEAYGYRGLALLYQKKDVAAARDLKKCFELDESLRNFFGELAKEVVESRRVKARRTY